jgi:branched-chain amino acid transport system permease protein
VSLPVLAQVVLSGLGAGVVYALIAVGISLIGGLRGTAPLAQGDLLGGSLATSVVLVVGAAPLAVDPSPGAAALIVTLTLLAGVIGGGLLYAVSGGRLAGGGGVQAAAAALAIGVLVRDAITHEFPRGSAGIGDPLHLDQLLDRGSGVISLGGGTSIPSRLPVVVALGALLVSALGFFLRRSSFGHGVAAVSQDRELAALSGVDPRRTLLGVFTLAGLLAALGGLLAVPGLGLEPDTGVLLGLTALLAAVAGGLGSVRGAVIAALVVGVAEAAIAHASAAAASPAILGALVVVALVRRGGESWAVRYR